MVQTVAELSTPAAGKSEGRGKVSNRARPGRDGGCSGRRTAEGRADVSIGKLVLDRDDRRVEAGDEDEHAGDDHEGREGIVELVGDRRPALLAPPVVRVDPHAPAERQAEEAGKQRADEADQGVKEGHLGEGAGEVLAVSFVCSVKLGQRAGQY